MPRTPSQARVAARLAAERRPDPDRIGWCLRETRGWYGIDRAVHRTAADAWHATTARGVGPAPAGALHFWTGGATGAGHVALGETRSRVWTIDNVRPGGVNLVSLERIARTWRRLHYCGWSRDLNGVLVVPRIQLVTATVNPDYVSVIARALRDEGLLHADATTWSPEVLAAYARWQARVLGVPATPGVRGPADGTPGRRTLRVLGLLHGFVLT